MALVIVWRGRWSARIRFKILRRESYVFGWFNRKTSLCRVKNVFRLVSAFQVSRREIHLLAWWSRRLKWSAIILKRKRRDRKTYKRLTASQVRFNMLDGLLLGVRYFRVEIKDLRSLKKVV